MKFKKVNDRAEKMHSGKVYYHSRGVANKAARQVHSKTGKTISVYKCPICLGYHLTSRRDR